jgi:hypothetical protein
LRSSMLVSLPGSAGADPVGCRDRRIGRLR